MNAENPKSYENPDLIWSPAQLHERLGDPNLRVIDARPGESFAMGHIPGASHFNVQYLTCDDTDEAPLQSFIHIGDLDGRLYLWMYLASAGDFSLDSTPIRRPARTCPTNLPTARRKPATPRNA